MLIYGGRERRLSLWTARDVGAFWEKEPEKERERKGGGRGVSSRARLRHLSAAMPREFQRFPLPLPLFRSRIRADWLGVSADPSGNNHGVGRPLTIVFGLVTRGDTAISSIKIEINLYFGEIA